MESSLPYQTYLTKGHVHGQFLNHCINAVRQMDRWEDFEDIWKEEADACIREYLKGSSEESMRYFIDNEEEYLCELFKIQYFIGEEDVSGKCPKSWEYMHEIIEDLYY